MHVPIRNLLLHFKACVIEPVGLYDLGAQKYNAKNWLMWVKATHFIHIIIIKLLLNLQVHMSKVPVQSVKNYVHMLIVFFTHVMHF